MTRGVSSWRRCLYTAGRESEQHRGKGGGWPGKWSILATVCSALPYSPGLETTRLPSACDCRWGMVKVEDTSALDQEPLP